MSAAEEAGVFASLLSSAVVGDADVTLSAAAAGYGMAPTGESVPTFTRVEAMPHRKGRKTATKAAPAPEIRAARRAAWRQAKEAAAALVRSAREDDPQARFIAADDLDRALGQLWALRADQDALWKMILNHAQGAIRQLFEERLVEQMTAHQTKAICDIVEQHLGPATKSVDDLTEALRLITDAGCDPYYAISGDPQNE
jgi:hypothetical protein